jgi:uroporphyrinogen III methyltransferase/synthase
MRIVVTRAREQADELIHALEEAGAVVLHFPAIRFVPPESFDSLDRAIDGTCDWLVFTSTNGVSAFFERLRSRSRNVPAASIAAVGEATAEALRAHEVEPDAIPRRFTGADLLPILGDVRGRRIAVVRAEEGREELIEGLRSGGAAVEVAIAYRTMPGDFDVEALRRHLRAGSIDVVTFTSPSTLVNLLAPLTPGERDSVLATRIVAIGTTTADAVRASGREPDAIAANASVAGIVEAVIAIAG